MSSPSDPVVPPAAERPGPDPAKAGAPAPVPPRPALRPVHLVALAAAVAGGAAATLLVMSAKPAARATAITTSAVTPTGEPAVSPASSAETAVSKWTTETQSRWVHNSRKAVAFEVSAGHSVPVWMKQVTPSLVVRCVDRKVDVFVYTDSPARIEQEDQDHTVRVRFDDEAGGHERWPDSLEHDALFARDGKTMAQRLKSARTFTFGFSPHNAAPVTVTFDVGGLAELMEPMAAKCGRAGK
jgi:hypothetical protein